MTIELPILGLLKARPMHGYELKRRMDLVLGFAWNPSYGSLYPMLRKLEAKGLIIKTSSLQGSGPHRQAYRLTPQGEGRLHELLLSEEYGHPLSLKILFFDQLTAQERRTILEMRRQQRIKAFEQLESAHSRPGDNMKKYQRILLDHGLDTVRQEIAWLDNLIQEEGTGDE
ncbi:MAG: PadR family transcriptional regulator [Chloroflexota bacterium]